MAIRSNGDKTDVALIGDNKEEMTISGDKKGKFFIKKKDIIGDKTNKWR